MVKTAFGTGHAWTLAFAMMFVAFAIGLFIDVRVSAYIHEMGIDAAFRRRGSWTRVLSEILKTPGEWYYALAAVVLVLWRRGITPAIAVFLAWVCSASNAVIKWIVGRERPVRGGEFIGDAWTFDFFRGGVFGVFEQTRLSFPSGHATAAFSIAMALALAFPRWGWIAIPAAAATAMERVLSGSHYISEIVFGAILGSACAYFVFRHPRFRPGSALDPARGGQSAR